MIMIIIMIMIIMILVIIISSNNNNSSSSSSSNTDRVGAGDALVATLAALEVLLGLHPYGPMAGHRPWPMPQPSTSCLCWYTGSQDTAVAAHVEPGRGVPKGHAPDAANINIVLCI